MVIKSAKLQQMYLPGFQGEVELAIFNKQTTLKIQITVERFFISGYLICKDYVM